VKARLKGVKEIAAFLIRNLAGTPVFPPGSLKRLLQLKPMSQTWNLQPEIASSRRLGASDEF
jgi:hypothetical protein